MDVKIKTKDNLKSRNDLVQLDIRHDLHTRKLGDKEGVNYSFLTLGMTNSNPRYHCFESVIRFR